MVKTIQNRIKTFFCGKTCAELFFFCLILSVFILGIVFRSQGYFNGNISLWLDEAEWVFKISDRSLLTNAIIRPVGFIAATSLFINIVNNEIVLRFIAYIPSILSIPLIYFIAREIYKSRLTVFLAVFIVSFNPVLINFAKEFKPYSLELFLHLLLIYLLLRYIKLKTTHTLYLLLFAATSILIFAYNIIFLFPSLFLILLFEIYKRQNLRGVFIALLTAVLIIGILSAFYYFLWSDRDILSSKIYWGKKYDVFCLSSNLSNNIKWVFHKYLTLIEYSGTTTIFWGLNFDGYEITKVALWVVHFIGLAAFVIKKRWDYLLLFVMPVLIIVLFNTMGLWPFGAFRVNVFMFCYFVIISLYGIDVALKTDKKYPRLAATSIIVTIFIILQFPLGTSYYTIKTPGSLTVDSNMRSAIETIFNYEMSKNAKKKCVIFADWHSFYPASYYLYNHSSLSEKYNSLHSDGKLKLYNIGLTCNEIMKSLNKITTDPDLAGLRVWILISKKSCIKKVDQYISNKNKVILKEIFRDVNLLIYNQISFGKNGQML